MTVKSFVDVTENRLTVRWTAEETDMWKRLALALDSVEFASLVKLSNFEHETDEMRLWQLWVDVDSQREHPLLAKRMEFDGGNTVVFTVNDEYPSTVQEAHNFGHIVFQELYFHTAIAA